MNLFFVYMNINQQTIKQQKTIRINLSKKQTIKFHKSNILNNRHTKNLKTFHFKMIFTIENYEPYTGEYYCGEGVYIDLTDDELTKTTPEIKTKKVDKIDAYKEEGGVSKLEKRLEELSEEMEATKKEIKKLMEKEPEKIAHTKSSVGKGKTRSGNGPTATPYDLRWILSSAKNKYPKCCPMKDGECEPKWNSTLLKMMETDDDYKSIAPSTMPTDWKGHKKPLRTDKAMKRHIANCSACQEL